MYSTPAQLLDFAHVNDETALTASKLAKQRILADYFKILDDNDLRLAIRFSGGHPSAQTDERTLGASGAIVSDAILSLRPMSGRDFGELIVRHGEIGEALSWMWTQFPPIKQREDGHFDQTAIDAAPMTLARISKAFQELAATGNQQRKRNLLRELFAACTHPREATYLAKIIFGDLRTGVKEGVLQAAVALAFEKPLAAIQRCQLLVGDLDEVAVLAKHDALESAAFKLFHPIQFMLAAPQETAQEAAATMNGRSFFAEDKLDGIRAQVHKSGDGASARIAIYTRTMDRTDESFPDVVAAIRQVDGEFLLDGEIVPMRDGVVLPFAHIQRRLGRKVLSKKMLAENPCAFVAFDILCRDGQLLMDQPLRERQFRLRELSELKVLPTTTVSSADDIDRAFKSARDSRNEGLVLKDPDSIYSPGRRGQTWLKLKTHLPTLDCVVTAAEYGHGKRKGVLSDYTFAVWTTDPSEPNARLVNIGKAYSGVTDEEIAKLNELFLSISLAQQGHVHLVGPKIVLEIACDQIQKSDRHESGYALRFPRIKRIRWDKKTEYADRLQRVIELYRSVENTAHAKEVTETLEMKEKTLFD